MVLYTRAHVGPTTKTSDGISIICLFRLILQAKSFVLFYLWYSSCFEVKCWIHTFPKRCSHIAMWILILLIIEFVMSTLFQPVCFSKSGSNHFSTSARSTLSFLTGVCFVHPKLSLFSPPSHPFLQGLIYVNQVSIYSCEVTSTFSINVLIWCSLVKMLTSFKFIILHCCFFSGGSNSSFQCWSYSFPRVKCFFVPVHLLIFHFSLFICPGVLKISQKTCVSILSPFKLFGDCYLIQAI